jgi:O-antigen/teichoic acid export membrane protein
MSSQTTDNNKRIAKNTLLLYFRMLLMMFVTLFTSRVVLDKLGVTDYGIYNVVGGVVAMLGFLNSSMSNAVQRYLSFEIGKNNEAGVNRIFNVSLFAHAGIAVFVFVVMEIVGVWYLNTHMNIPAERMDAANWVLQCSIFTTLFTIVQVPYNAIIISKEQMGIYAYISILEVVLKLLVVYMLAIRNFDKLKLYSVLIMVVTIGIVMIYRCYCTRKYKEAKFKFVKDWNLLKQIVGFASWNMLGELAWVFTGQGVNIILNSFFGPVVNAARGLAEQVNGAVNRFVANFQTAVNPQLIKNYASDQLGEMKTLLFRSTRFSYYLLLTNSKSTIYYIKFPKPYFYSIFPVNM